MEIRWELPCQVVATHVTTYALEVKEKELNSFHVIVDGKIFTYQKV